MKISSKRRREIKTNENQLKVYENKLKSAQRDKNQGFDLIIVKISIREIKSK
jgi:hypothetical protein